MPLLAVATAVPLGVMFAIPLKPPIAVIPLPEESRSMPTQPVVEAGSIVSERSAALFMVTASDVRATLTLAVTTSVLGRGATAQA